MFTPLDEPAFDDTKGERVFEVVDARTLRVIKRLDMGQKLEEAGYRLAAFGQKPYGSTNSGDGRYCFVSFSGDDRVAVISYASEKEVGSVRAGRPVRLRVCVTAKRAGRRVAVRGARVRVRASRKGYRTGFGRVRAARR